MQLRNPVHARARSGLRGYYRRGGGSRRLPRAEHTVERVDIWRSIGRRSVVLVGRILEGEERSEQNNLETFAIVNVEAGETCVSLITRRRAVGGTLPVEVIIKQLHGRGLYAACGFLRNGDEDRRVGFSDHVALLAFPFKLMSVRDMIRNNHARGNR